MTKPRLSIRGLALLTLTLAVSACPESSNKDKTPEPATEKSLPAKQLDDAKTKIEAATKALEVKANKVGEGSIAE